MAEIKFADSVWHRVVQIIQEAMLTGTDCSDYLRQIRCVPDESDPHVLVLSPEYQKQVREMHEKMLAQAREIQAKTRNNKFIIPPDGTDGDTN
jgi:hypothetical protein